MVNSVMLLLPHSILDCFAIQYSLMRSTGYSTANSRMLVTALNQSLVKPLEIVLFYEMHISMYLHF